MPVTHYWSIGRHSPAESFHWSQALSSRSYWMYALRAESHCGPSPVEGDDAVAGEATDGVDGDQVADVPGA